ncbi:MAG TPA: HAD-IA family hydrolase [Thermodesulfobacteriota bacterium]|nr:HAD-IA family hydrolase [Thermodesulfobacteriota bacterium]
MTNGKITTIFFDAADTLFFIKEGLGNTYAGVARKYGADPDTAALRRAFSKAFRNAPPLAFGGVSGEERKGLEKDWWKKVVTDVYTEVGMFPGFDEHFDELFEVFRTEAWTLFPETVPVLESLKSRCYKLGIISNFDSRVYDVMERLGIYDYFDTFVISSEAGFAKPSHGIYLAALEKAGVDPGESIHVGDDLRNDFHGPRALGIRAILLDREGEYASLERMDRIGDLTGLESYLNDSGASGLKAEG